MESFDASYALDSIDRRRKFRRQRRLADPDARVKIPIRDSQSCGAWVLSQIFQLGTGNGLDLPNPFAVTPKSTATSVKITRQSPLQHFTVSTADGPNAIGNRLSHVV